MTHYPFWPVTIAVLLTGSAIVFGRLKRNAQPLRLELADKGEAILGCPDSSENARTLAHLYLDTAFSFRGQLLLSQFVIPVLAVIHFFRELRRTTPKPPPRKEHNADVQKLLEEMDDLNTKLTLANHPILGTLAFVSMFVWFLIATLLVVVIKGVIPSRVPAGEINECVNYAYIRIPSQVKGRLKMMHIGA